MAGWIETNRFVVFPAHCDHLGHMNVRYYAHAFDDASFHIWARVGLTYDRMGGHGLVTVVVRTATDFVQEVTAGTLLVVESAFTGLGSKSITYRQRLLDAERGTLHARQETVEVFFDPRTRKAADMPAELRALIEANLISDVQS